MDSHSRTVLGAVGPGVGGGGGVGVCVCVQESTTVRYAGLSFSKEM